ncbi:MAG: cadmium resistance transporter [Nitrososphaera sp.]|jgi:cadmium resistance transport/sequestration family protein
MDIPAIIGIGVAAFIATNIDDIVVLIVFFSQALISARQVTFGQYVGFSILVAVSVAGSLVSLVVPVWVVGLMGLLPIGIGIKKLLEKENEEEEIEEAKERLEKRQRWKFLTVAAITIANGGDNIGIYVPIFATSTFSDIAGIVIVFMVMVALWCGFAYYLVNHSFLAERIKKVGGRLLPFVLIGLGIYILAEAFLIPSF